MIGVMAMALAGATVPTAARFQCGGTVVVARYYRQRAMLDFDGRRLRLAQTVSADGARYTGLTHRQRVEFWTRGDWARLTIGKRTWPECRLANLPAG
jgi:membrane-bound inhibitor of C-type lysozyme